MWTREQGLRATAHRGLHDKARGIIENTWPAFEAAIAGDYGIECDLQRSKDNVPLVFHDFTLDRLIAGSGRVADHKFEDLKALSYKNHSATMLSFEVFLGRVAGRVPLLVELKSNWTPPNRAWLNTVCQLCERYHGPLALMSFDPDVLCAVKDIAPAIARGFVSGVYRHPNREPWYQNDVSDARALALSNLEPIDTIEPDLLAYHVHDLDCPAISNARQNLKLPVFAWTVRTAAEWQLCETFADAAIFEGAPR